MKINKEAEKKITPVEAQRIAEEDQEEVVDACELQDLRDMCVNGFEREGAYALRCAHEGDENEARFHEGEASAYSAVAEEIADRLSDLGIPWSRKE